MTDLPDYDDPKLTPQEEWLVRCAEKGEWWAWWTQGSPLSSDTWDSSRVLRASVIRALAAGDIWPTRLAPWPVHRKGLKIVGAWILGELDLGGASVERTLWLHDSAFDKAVTFVDAKTKTVSLRGSRVPGLRAGRCNFDGSLHLMERFSAEGEVNFLGATIKGQLSCDGASFVNPGGKALNCDTLNVGADMFLRNGFSATGEVNIIGATIKGQLSCTGGRFENPGGTALDCDAVSVGAEVHFNAGFSAKGEVNLRGATIEGQFSCNGGSFDNPSGMALNCDALAVGSNMLLRDGFSAKGEVNLRGATIEGQLSCDGGSFDNPDGKALNCDALTIRADAFLRDGFSAKGKVDFVNAKIGSNLVCMRATFDHAVGEALDLTLAQIGAGLVIHSLEPPEGNGTGLNGWLVLSQAKCRTYRDEKSSWPETGKLVLDGFSYERFDDCATDCDMRREWLSRQVEKHLQADFRPQPWTQAMKVLRDMGHDRQARNLGLEFEKARERRAGTHRLWRYWHYFTYYTIGCGYKPEWAVWWSLGFILFGWLTFAAAANLGFMAPRDGSVVAYLAANPSAEIPDDYTKFNALVFAADAYLPVIELGQDLSWEPSPEQHGGVRPLAPEDDGWTCASRLLRGDNAVWQEPKTLPRSCGYPQDTRWRWLTGSLHWLFRHGFHRVVYWLDEILGWTFISLFIAGMSGLMKKE